MTEGKAKRKLTAILSADVKGYSRLMADDEEATVRTINAYREVMTSLVKDHRGRVVDAKGDNVLAEFSSVVDAVRCAVQVQKELTDRNSELPENRKMEFRIGINLGDVIEEQGTIYGDGVNVAARLEGLAEGGGICISGTAFDQVKSRVSVGYKYQGKQNVKNIPDPVRAYKVLLDPGAAGKVIGEDEPGPRKKQWAAIGAVVVVALVAGGLLWNYYLVPDVEPASEEKMAFPLPEKPSIAVLPFVNMSGDPNQDYLSDGITEQIITYLSMNPDMFVIASNSVFTYKGKPVKIHQVAEELGVKYVLEGSVQSVGDRLRITAQLIDALRGKHLWADQYDRELKDIFTVQDEITVNIFNELQVMFKGWEKWQEYTGPKSLDYLKKTSEAWSYFRTPSPKNMEQARELYEEAITLEPDAPMTYTLLGHTYAMKVFYGSKSPGKDIQRAFELAQKTIELTNDSIGDPHILMSMLYSVSQKYEKAIEEAEKAAAISPNSADARRQLGLVYNYVGRREEAIKAAKQAIRLNPHPDAVYYNGLGLAHLMAGQYDEAIEAFKKALHLNPKFTWSRWGLALAYSLSGLEKEAKAEVEEFLLLAPGFRVKDYEMRGLLAFKNQADRAFLADAMRKAGFPD